MKNRILKITRRVITTILSIMMLLPMLLAVYNFFSVKVLKQDYSNVFGYTVFEVISGSMSPTIDKYDVILVKIDDDYKVGDVISFKSNGAIITHRITEIKGDTYITRGDANNTIDKPINKDMVIGKVVRTFSKVGVWIKVLTTPKIMIACFITMLLMLYTIRMLKIKEEKQVREIKEDNVERRREMIEKLKHNNRLKIEICIFVILLALLTFLIPYTFSRLRTETRAAAPVDIAFFLAKDTYTHDEINLTNMKPGDTYSYTFSVSNTDGEHRSEVNMDYYVEIKATTNLPLGYEFYLTNGGVDLPIIGEEEIISDDDGTYFKIIKTSSRPLNYNNDYTDYYKLTITFGSEYTSHNYQDVAENIEISVNAKQKLDTDE